MSQKKKIGWVSAAALVVANMIGIGVFTTLGLQLDMLGNTWTILSLWVIGGLIALLGAFSYAELGTKFPKSGGEYHFLSKIYHPFLGYLSGWVSLTVGFATSIALSAMAMGAYLKNLFPFSGLWIGLGSIVLLSIIHSFSIRQSSFFQNIFTLLKILFIAFLIFSGFFITSDANAFDFGETWKVEVFSPAYAVALVYVMHAFSGWNAAAYIVDEIDRPKRNLPLALIGGTILVSILFIFLQMAFLNQVKFSVLAGNIEIGQIVAEKMFGNGGGSIVGGLIALMLVANISAMIWVGPRVTRAMADKYAIWQFFAKDNPSKIPVRAIWLQAFISILMVLTSSFEQILTYSGFILQLFTTLTVAGVIVARFKKIGKQGYNSPAYPWVQLVFLAFSIWVLVYLLYAKPYESMLGLVNLLAGGLSYLLNQHQKKAMKQEAIKENSHSEI
jgi:APA family basic amino acid/polyamine antiporter